MALGRASRVDTANAIGIGAGSELRFGYIDVGRRTEADCCARRKPLSWPQRARRGNVAGANEFGIPDSGDLLGEWGPARGAMAGQRASACDVSGRGPDYSLMLRLSGVGLTLFEVHDTEVPGALLPICPPSHDLGSVRLPVARSGHRP